MRKFPLVVSALVGGAIVALVLVVGNLVDIKIEIRRAPTSSAQKPAANASRVPQSRSPSVGQDFVASSGEPRRLVESASKLTSAGQLREAQERYLQVLLVNPDDQEAMRGLVRVRRLMARNDAPTLRREAATYRRALTQGKETKEHYTASAMDLLAVASLQAAAELEDSPNKARRFVTEPRAPTPKPTPTASPREVPRPKTQLTSSRPEPRPQPKPREVVRRNVERRQVARPITVQPPAPPPSLVTPATEPPPDQNEPFVTITLGPIASRGQASSITSELTVAGYVARVRRGGADYLITLGPYRRSVAERIASRIRTRFGQGISVSLNPTSD